MRRCLLRNSNNPIVDAVSSLASSLQVNRVPRAIRLRASGHIDRCVKRHNGATASRGLGRTARGGSRRGCVYLSVSGRSNGRLVRASRRCLWGRPGGGSARLLRFHRVLGAWSVCRRPTDDSNQRRVHRACRRNPDRDWSRVRISQSSDVLALASCLLSSHFLCAASCSGLDPSGRRSPPISQKKTPRKPCFMAQSVFIERDSASS
jgi:hypothetical protein